MVIGVFTPWAGALAQWINSGDWPSKIVWIGVILPASAIGGANAWIAFTSSAFSDYSDKQNQQDTNTPAPSNLPPATLGK